MVVVDCLSALHYLESLYAKGVFGCDPALPTIVLKHQLYSLHDDRTLIDREVVSIQAHPALEYSLMEH